MIEGTWEGVSLISKGGTGACLEWKEDISNHSIVSRGKIESACGYIGSGDRIGCDGETGGYLIVVGKGEKCEIGAASGVCEGDRGGVGDREVFNDVVSGDI